jgi:hypothetical protein
MSHTIEVPIESLAKQSPPTIAMSRTDCDTVAKLAMLLAQESQRAEGQVLAFPHPTYESLTPDTRASMRGGVVRVVQALAMLGWIDPPE